MAKKINAASKSIKQDFSFSESFSDDKMPYYIIGIVALVAVIGLIVFFNGNNDAGISVQNVNTVSEDITGNVAGFESERIYPEDYAVDADSIESQSNAQAEQPKSWPFN